jgi:carbonic anhydrase
VTKLHDEVQAENAAFAADFVDRERLKPNRRFAVLTCMDARMNPVEIMGIHEGEAHVIRNAGGRASDDAIRSLLMSYHVLGTIEWFVIQHTKCGMEQFTDETIHKLVGASGWHYDSNNPYTHSVKALYGFHITNHHESVTSDVKRIRNHPLVPLDVTIYGYIYDVDTGLLEEVPEATAAGVPVSLRAELDQ